MILNKIRRKIEREGLAHTIRDIHNRNHIGRCDYGVVMPAEELQRQRNFVFEKNPRISIIVPLFNTDEYQLRRMLQSVMNQTYTNFELCMVDYSDEDHGYVGKVVEEFEIGFSTDDDKYCSGTAARADDKTGLSPEENQDCSGTAAKADSYTGFSAGNYTPQIIFEKGTNKGIAENTNECIRLSHGEYIALLDHDDMLHPSSLFEAVQAINAGGDFIYTDEVKFQEKRNNLPEINPQKKNNNLSEINPQKKNNNLSEIKPQEKRNNLPETDSHNNQKNASVVENLYPEALQRPNFKPDFTYAELCIHNYICHFNVYSRQLYDKVGGYRQEYDGSQDHDMMLRLTAAAEKIIHIRKILYFWRIHAGSVAGGIEAKPYATLSGIKAITEQLSLLKNNIFEKDSLKEKTDSCSEKTSSTPKTDSYSGKLSLKAESIHDNVPIYRLKVVGAPITMLGSSAAVETQNIATSNSVRELTWGRRSGMQQENLKKEILDTTEDFLILHHEDVKINSEMDVNELLMYSIFPDVIACDSKLVSNGRLVSGGVFYNNGRLQYRSPGMPEGYQGYEADYHHARTVSGISGMYSCLYMKNIRRMLKSYDLNPSMDENSNDDVAMSRKVSMDHNLNLKKNELLELLFSENHCMWTPFYEATVVKDAEPVDIYDLLGTMNNGEIMPEYKRTLPDYGQKFPEYKRHDRYYREEIEKYKLD